MSVIKIIPAHKTDFDQLLNLWKITGLDLADDKTEYIESMLMLKLNPNTCLVAKIKNQVIGSAFGIFNGRRAWIYHLAVNPIWQRQNIGSQLIQATENALFRQKATKVRLWVGFTNLKVVPFYEKHGYTVMSDAIMMGKTITKPASFRKLADFSEVKGGEIN